MQRLGEKAIGWWPGDASLMRVGRESTGASARPGKQTLAPPKAKRISGTREEQCRYECQALETVSAEQNTLAPERMMVVARRR